MAYTTNKICGGLSCRLKNTFRFRNCRCFVFIIWIELLQKMTICYPASNRKHFHIMMYQLKRQARYDAAHFVLQGYFSTEWQKSWKSRRTLPSTYNVSFPTLLRVFPGYIYKLQEGYHQWVYMKSIISECINQQFDGWTNSAFMMKNGPT